MTEAAHRAQLVAVVAASQSGLVTPAQLAAAGITRSTVRSNLAAARWQRLSPRVIAMFSGELSPEQRAWFAVLDGGEHCVIAGLSALHHQGLSGFPVDRVQTAVPETCRGARTDTYVRRRCRRLTPAAVHPARRPPMMRVPDAIVDALHHINLPLRGCALLAAVVQQRLIPATAVRALVTADTALPHRKVYAAVAGDIEGGSQSLLEIDFARLARRAGIPPPRQQVVRCDRQGRRRYLDADFGGFVAEVDGAVHLKPLAWWDDMFRQNAIVIADRPMLRFASVGIRLRADEVVAQLRAGAARWL